MPFDIAQFYFDQRFRIAEDAPVLRQLIEAVGRTSDLGPPQWAQWYSVVLGFAPDLIVELGRGYGNSTALFAQAARRLRAIKIVSLCRSDDWASIVAPRIARIVDDDWFASVDARRADILFADFTKIIADHQRVLLLWDAHGFEIAELVLGEILPLLASRDHLVLMHDISDNRYDGVSRSYEGQPVWKGSKWQQRSRAWNSRVNIGWMNSKEDQVIALADFAARNDLEIGSADHEYATFFETHPACADEMRHVLADEFFSTRGHWAFLSLSGKEGPFHMPPLSGWKAAANRSAVVSDQLPWLPARILTAPVPWAYAFVFSWRSLSQPPPGAQAWIRCRLQVTGGPIGVSLLTQDEKAFVDSRFVSSPIAVTVALQIPDMEQCGRLVIHTWDAPEAGWVSIDDIAVVW